MSDILSLINEYRVIVGAILSFMALVIALNIWWDEVKLFVLNLWYKTPLMGKTARLSKDLHIDDNKFGDAIWFSAERQLCEDYFNHFSKVAKDADHYDKCATYLRKVDETGRNNLHFIGWVLIAAMVFVEAMGFSYVLSGFTVPGASENVQQIGALGIAFLVSVLLVGFTHFSGHELHYNSLIKKVKSKWRKSGSDEALDADNSVSLDENADEDQPQWKQMLNRLPHNAQVTPTYKITILASILIAVVAIGATYVRGKVLEQEAAEVHVSANMPQQVDADPYADIALPGALQEVQDEADTAAKNEALDAYKSGGWAAFVVLAFIFIFIQILGIVIGYKTGFAGKEASVARKDLGKFKTKREFVNHYARKKQLVSRQAQKNLTSLQQKLAARAASVGTEKQLIDFSKHTEGRSFLRYAEIAMKDERDTDKRVSDEEVGLVDGSVLVKSKLKSDASESKEQFDARIVKEEKARLLEEITREKTESEQEVRDRIRKELIAEMKLERELV